MTHEYRIGGFDDDQIIDPDERDRPAVTHRDVVLRIHRHHGTTHGVARRISRQMFGQRRPESDIVPVELRQHRLDRDRLFHDRVVHGNLRLQRRKFRRQKRRRITGGKLADETRQHRRVFIRLGQKCRCTPEKHPGVPRIVAALDITRRRRRIGFFHETFYLAKAISGGLAQLEITKTRGRMVRLDRKRQQRR